MAGVAVAEAVAVILPVVLPHIVSYIKERQAKKGSKQELSDEELKKVFGERLIAAINRVSPVQLYGILQYIDKLRKQGIPDCEITPKLYARFPEFADLVTEIVSGFNAQETDLPISVRLKQPDELKLKRAILTAMRNEALAILEYDNLLQMMKSQGEPQKYIDIVTHIRDDEMEHKRFLEQIYREKVPIEYPYSEEYD